MKQDFLRVFLYSCLVLLIAAHSSFSQNIVQSQPVPYYPYPLPFFKPDFSRIDSSGALTPTPLHPILGLGAGVFTFYGDVSGEKMKPVTSRLCYNFSISEYLSRSFLFSARALFGKLGANEKGTRFLNFESSIRSGGLNISYNFDKLLPKKRRIDPFVLTGFEYFEYLSKTDLFDDAGNQYYYWSNGSIMSTGETDPNATSAVSLIQDYKYETDVRKWNNELFGKYPERSFAVPVGAGVNFRIAPRWNFKLGATMHFTFTDYIDGVTETNKGTGKGDKKKDKFLETYFTLTYDLFSHKPPYIPVLSEEELILLACEDTDGDGVADFNDSCQGTPPGVVVDAKGCPPDSDGDRFPDYADKEPNSPIGALVDDYGVALDDSTIARNWHVWSDTINQYVVYNEIINPPAVTGGNWNKARLATIVYKRDLAVLLGTYKEGVPATEMDKLLSVPDVRSSMQADSTTAYTVGSYSKTVDAEKRREEMLEAGFQGAKVIVRNKDGSLADPTTDILAGFKGGDISKDAVPVNKNGVVYRIQLGAYSKKLSSSVFKNAGQLIELKTEDGLYKYVSGSYASIQDAIKARGILLQKGYQGAFIVAYKGNKRVPLSGVSGGIIQSRNENMEESKVPASVVDKSLIYFRLQIGSFVNEPPEDILQKLNKISGIEKKKKPNGVVQYVAGKFFDYESAKIFKDEIINQHGLPDAFLIAYFKDEPISIQEALELLK